MEIEHRDSGQAPARTFHADDADPLRIDTDAAQTRKQFLPKK
jgi:hypothetical protein